MPAVTAWNAGGIGIGFLVTAGTIESWDARVCRTTHYICEVSMSIIALLGIARRSMAVNASRVGED
jgi:hypothetical protein